MRQTSNHTIVGSLQVYFWLGLLGYLLLLGSFDAFVPEVVLAEERSESFSGLRPGLKSSVVGHCFAEGMMEEALETYFLYGLPYDSLLTLDKRGVNNMEGLMVTLIDLLDTLVITNRIETFHTAVRWIAENVKDFNKNVTVSVFEATIRVLGGLLSAHMMIEEGVVPVDKEHPYTGELLVLAADLGDRLLVAYNTSTGLPFGSVNLRSGVDPNEVTETANAAAGTNLLEMMMLTRLTGDPKYLQAAERSVEALLESKDRGTKLLGSHIDIESAQWTIIQSSIGTGQDSTLEYLFKYHVVSGQLKWWLYFESLRVAMLRYLRIGGLYGAVNMRNPTRFCDSDHDSLASFYPGLLLTAGRQKEGLEPLWTAHSIYRRYGAMPEVTSRSVQMELRGPNYPLRPEHLESVYYYYKATHDPAYRAMAEEFAMGLHLRCRTLRGFAPLQSVEFPHHRNTSTYGPMMESFLISETLKYLYLIFQEDEVEGGGGQTRAAASPVLRREWVLSTEAHFIPDSIIWWDPAKLQRPTAPGVAENVNRERLKNIDELMSGLEARVTQESELVRRNKFRKRFWITDLTLADYVCQNQPVCSLHRLSDSLIR